MEEVWMVVFHYLHLVGVEFMAEIGDVMVTHYIVVIVLKAGAVQAIAIVAHKVYRSKKPVQEKA